MSYVRGAAGARYPEVAGFKARDTSRAAAEGVEAGPAQSNRQRIFESIRAMPATPETLGARLDLPLHYVRPRVTELAKRGLIEDSGERGPASGGRRAIIWRVKR